MSYSIFDSIFGKDSQGDTVEARASTSSSRFIRSQHQLSIWREGAQGRVLGATEALRQFGWEILKELADHSSVPFIESGANPNTTLKNQIEEIGVNQNILFKKAKFTNKDIESLLGGFQVPFRKMEYLAQLLALDADSLGRSVNADADLNLRYRLRALGNEYPRLSSSLVMALTEAAWVIRKQLELSELLGEEYNNSKYTPDNNYGEANAPAWRCGLRLAVKTRKLLGIGPDTPIESMTSLLEEELGIPVIHIDLPVRFAGATIANGNSRGIVVNIRGGNEQVWVKRMTLAHELGHFLWDPDDQLNRLIVDSYQDIEQDFVKRKDVVEQRANAFAVEFLAPRDTLANIFVQSRDQKDAVENIIQRFGIGLSSTIFHLQNRLHNVSINPGKVHITPDQSLIGREETALSLFKPDDVPLSRRGRFSVLVWRAFKRNLISADSLGALLGCPPEKTDKAIDWLRSIDG